MERTISRFQSAKLTQNTLPFYAVLFFLTFASWYDWFLETDIIPQIVLVVATTMFVILCFLGDNLAFIMILLGQIIWLVRFKKVGLQISRYALLLSSDSPIVQNQVAYMMTLTDENLDEAESIARLAYEKNSNSANIADTLGWILYKQKKYDEAISYLSKASSNLLFNSHVNLHHGLCLWMLGKHTPARRHLTRALWFRFFGGLSVEEKKSGIAALKSIKRKPIGRGFEIDKWLKSIAAVIIITSVLVYRTDFMEEVLLWGKTKFDPQPARCWATKLFNSHVAQIEVDRRIGNFEEVLDRWFLLRESFVSENSKWFVDMNIADLLSHIGEFKQSRYIYQSLFEDMNDVTQREMKNPLHLALADVLSKNLRQRNAEARSLIQKISKEYLEPPGIKEDGTDGRFALFDHYQTLVTYWSTWSLIYEKELKWSNMLEAEKKCLEASIAAKNSLRKFDFYTDIQTILMHRDMNSYLDARKFVLGEWESKWITKLIESYYRQGVALRKLNDPIEAKQMFSNAERYSSAFWKIQEKLDSPSFRNVYDSNIYFATDAWKILYYMSKIYEIRGDLVQSFHAAKKAVDLIKNIRVKLREKNRRANFAVGREVVYEQAVYTALANDKNDLAFSALEALKSRRLLDDFAVHWYQDETNNGLADLDDVEMDSLSRVNLQIHRIVQRANPSKKLKGLMQLRQKFIRQRDERFSFDSDRGLFFEPVKTSDLLHIQNTLNAGETVLEYFLSSNEEVWVFLIGKDNLNVFKLAATATNILEKSKMLQLEVQSKRKISSSLWKRPARELYSMCLEDYAALIPSGQHLIIVPHRGLHSIPFEILLDGNEEPLIQRYTVSYAPSSTVFSYIRDLWSDKSEVKNKDFLVVSDPSHTLPGALNETQYLRENHNARIISEAASTPGNLLDLMGDAGIIHLSTHGIADPEEPLLSFLIVEKDSRFGGLLDIRTILRGRSLVNASLVTLAACQTGFATENLPGDEVYNFGTSFLAAGARSSVSARWNVSDQATTLLIKTFYDNLEQGLAQALRISQLELRKRYPHPYFWGAFMVMGDIWN